MGLTITKTGPYFAGVGGVTPNNQTEVKFSQLRNTFRLNNPTGAISASELLRDIDVANNGKNIKESIQDLQNEMEKAASNLEFEEAARIRDEIKKLQQKELGLMAIPNTDFKINSNSKKK